MAELIAMTLFVYVGCGAAVSSQSMLGLNPEDTRSNSFLVAVALAFGIGISVLAYAIAPVSGGHINPAVTFAFMLLKGINPILGLLYIAAQCVGAVLGAALVYGTFASNQLMTLSGEKTPPFMLGVNGVSPGVPVGSGFLGELMGTYLLVFTVMMTAVYRHVSAQVKVGRAGKGIYFSDIVSLCKLLKFSFGAEYCLQHCSDCHWLVRLFGTRGAHPHHWMWY